MNAPARVAPADLAALAAALRRATVDTRLVAGGTDLALELRADGFRPDLLIDLSGLRMLSFVRREDERLRVGALTTFAQLRHDSQLLDHATALAQAAARVGSQQIRNLATLGGNVAHASACADAVPALLVLEADAGVLRGDGSIVRQPVRDLIAMEGGTLLQVGELLVDFAFTALSPRQRSAFAKVGARVSVAVAKLNAALVVTLDPDGRSVQDARVAFGSIAPSAFISLPVAAALRGQAFDEATGAMFADACAQRVAEAIPDRSSMPYKRSAIRGLADDLWRAVLRDP